MIALERPEDALAHLRAIVLESNVELRRAVLDASDVAVDKLKAICRRAEEHERAIEAPT